MILYMCRYNMIARIPVYMSDGNINGRIGTPFSLHFVHDLLRLPLLYTMGSTLTGISWQMGSYCICYSKVVNNIFVLNECVE